MNRNVSSAWRRIARSGAVAGAVAGVAGVLSAGALGSTASGATVFLDSNHGPDITRAQCNAMGGCGPTVSAPVVLEAGKHYTIQVSGTISVFGYWVAHPCGHPGAHPIYPTSGPNNPTSDDAVFRFAIHSRGPCSNLPRRTGLFQINLGQGWFSPTPAGNPSRPTRGIHAYRFEVVGDGAAPSFRFVDYHPSDNTGAFRIVVGGGR